MFVTLTAPSFGAVHTTCDDTHGTGALSPGPRRRPALPARETAVVQTTTVTMTAVGQPLCADCYDYTGHVLFAWHAPELWRRFTITLRRLLDSHLRAMR